MRLFEAIFKHPTQDFNQMLRYSENGVTKTETLNLYSTCYIPDKLGKYKFLFNQNLRLSKVEKKYHKENPNTFGECSIASEYIRENFWSLTESKYNMKPSIFYLDIETTAHAQINTDLCNERIVSIQIYHNLTNTNIILANEDFDIQKHTSKNGNYNFDNRDYDFKLKYIKLNTEIEILNTFFKIIELLKPLLVLAHNGEGFDFAYLWRRSERAGIKEGFSPFGPSKFIVNELENGTKKYRIDAPGVFYMDTIEIYKKFRLKPRESYSLDYLAEVELGEHKVNHNCYSTFDGFRTGQGYKRPPKEPKKESILEYKLFHAKDENEIIQISKEYFIHYSIIDTFLLYKIDKAISLTDIMLNVCSSMGVQLNQSLGTTTPWTNYIRNYALTKNIVLPNPRENREDVAFKGGFVAEPKVGRYDWVYSVDVTSMYPSQIMAFNLSSETFISYNKLPEDLVKEIDDLNLNEDEEYHLKEYFNNPNKYKRFSELLKKYNYCGSLSGAIYDKSKQGLIPYLVELQFKERKRIKNQMLEIERLVEIEKDPVKKFQLEERAKLLDVSQHTVKIRINALYGALSNKHFLLYNLEIAKSITSNSRFYVNLMSKNIENYQKTFDKDAICIYNDTDSGYFLTPKSKIQGSNINEITDNISNYIENEIQPNINATSQELGNIFNALDASKISAKREAIAENAVFIAKKRYFMKVIDSEFVRFEKPKLKMTGIDIVRSSTPAFSKIYLKKSIDIILESSESELKKWISSVRELYQKSPLLDIAKTSSVSSANYKIGIDKSIPINSRAFLVTNDYLEKTNNSEFPKLELGEKVKMLYLKTPNPLNSNIFAFNNEEFAELFQNYIDYDTNFDKFFVKTLEIMTTPLNYNLYKVTEDLEIW